MTAIVLIAVIAATVWGMLFVLRGSLIGGCLAFLLAACCFSHTFLEFDLGPLPLTLDRIALVLLALAYLVQWRLGRTDPKPATGVDLLVLLLAGLLAASTFTSDWRVDAPGEISPLWRLIFGYLMPMTVYWIARQSPLSSDRIWWVQAALAAFAVYLAITGLAEVTRQWWLVYPKYIADPSVGIHFGRARGPMVQAACYGTALAICMLAAWIWRGKLGRAGQLGVILLMPLFGAAIYFTYTRSAWLESALGLLVVLALTLQGRMRSLVIGGVLAAGLVVAVANWDSLLGFQREQSAAETRKSAQMRASFAYASWLMFQDRPLWGCGFGQYRTEVLPYLADRSSDFDLESIRGYVHHNTLLCILVENGLLGLLAFASILLGWTRAAWILWRSPHTPDWARGHAVLLLGTMVTYLCQALSRDVTYTAVENLLLFFLAGITMGLLPLAGRLATAPSRVTWPKAFAGQPARST